MRHSRAVLRRRRALAGWRNGAMRARTEALQEEVAALRAALGAAHAGEPGGAEVIGQARAEPAWPGLEGRDVSI
jgi:hypothetical protein